MAPWTLSAQAILNPNPKQFSIADHALDKRRFPNTTPNSRKGTGVTISPWLNTPHPPRVCSEAGTQEPRQRAWQDVRWSQALFLFSGRAGRSGRRLAFSHHLRARDTHGPDAARCWLLITRPPVKTRMADELRTSSQLDNR